jgi:hypothetical protein
MAIRQTAIFGFGDECFCRMCVNALPGQHYDLLGPRQTLKMKDAHFPTRFEERAKRCKIAFAEPISSPARNSHLRRINGKQLSHERIDCVAVRSSGPFLIEPVDE